MASVVKLNVDGVDYSCTPVPMGGLVLNINDVDYVCTPAATSGLILVPAGVTPIIFELDALDWTGVHDDATSGTAVGTTSYPVDIGGRQARSFPNTFTSNGGLRYHTVYSHDAEHKHFVFAGDLWIDDNPDAIDQMELDNNQVLANGGTVIYGVQCNANSGAWDITIMDPNCRWIPSSAKGNPHDWPKQKWLHFEHLHHRDDEGNVTYESVYFDGTTQQINQTLPSIGDLRWGQDCLVNVQIGGNGDGSVLVYGSNLQVAMW